ncbi:universal stress protein [Thermodesulfobacterium hydrogeniphilum]|uniref:universal stress protein n=1 Tax=Thermodesulfobacterium hydrogeniphilum TaxID=161156 RepID=UPI00056FEE42|nr:universal stress protein [Thermodesulfobacterium hydrogeniphilum]
MLNIKTIAVPVDFSDVASLLAQYAKDFAKKLGAKIILIYVLEDLTAYEGLYTSTKILTDLENMLLEGAEKSMKDFIKKYFSDCSEVEPVIVKGDIVEKIIETAQKYKADLIIIGTHGRKGLDKILFGSVAEGVVKNSPIPVLTVNPYKYKIN